MTPCLCRSCTTDCREPETSQTETPARHPAAALGPGQFETHWPECSLPFKGSAVSRALSPRLDACTRCASHPSACTVTDMLQRLGPHHPEWGRREPPLLSQPHQHQRLRAQTPRRSPDRGGIVSCWGGTRKAPQPAALPVRACASEQGPRPSARVSSPTQLPLPRLHLDPTAPGLSPPSPQPSAPCGLLKRQREEEGAFSNPAGPTKCPRGSRQRWGPADEKRL